MYYYVMACETGREERNIKLLRQTVSLLRPSCHLEAWHAQRESKEFSAKKWTMMTRPIIPGYVVIASDEKLWSIQKEIFMMSDTCYGLLRNLDKTYELRGADERFAMWIERNDGLIRPSQVLVDDHGLTPNERVTVISGPMRELEGKILSIYKGVRVTVEIVFLGEPRKVVLPIEIVKRIPKEEQTTSGEKEEEAEK